MPFLVPRKLPYIWIINESKENTSDGKKKAEMLIWQNKSDEEREKINPSQTLLQNFVLHEPFLQA